MYEPSDFERSRSRSPSVATASRASSSSTPSRRGSERVGSGGRVPRCAGSRGELGADVREERGLRRPGPERTLAVTREVLERNGFEPYSDHRGEIALRNCPFHSLAQRAPDLVCGMNRARIEGVVRGLGNDFVEAVLTCKPGDCCVTVRVPEA